MNKNKKIAMAVVATVMAGAMVVPLAACNNDKPQGGGGGGLIVKDEWNILNDDGSINYDSYKRDSEVTLNIAIGHEKDTQGTSYKSGTTYSLADGNNYVSGDIKPAWAQMGKDLNIKWNDLFVTMPNKTSENLKALITNQKYSTTDMFTTDLSKAVEYAAANTDILNLADYLDCMPNFNRFLNENPVVYLSLLQDGMNTKTGAGKTLYIAPYFDGNDDIERYCIIRQDMADKLLNGDTVLAGSTAWGKGASVQAFMPKEGTLEIPVTVDSGDHTTVGKVYKNYANVKAELNKTDSALRTAYNAASNNAAVVDSGNIVDIMNAAITANNAVTGDKLVALFRAYVDACYTKTDAVGSESYYAADKRSNLFNGYDAAWDVDDLVAVLRCAMTNQDSLLSKDLSGATRLYGIAPRTGQNDRTPDMVRLACQLYGARGADSRLEYTYIDKDGKLQDARNDKGFYEALNNFSKLKEEGLIEDYSGISSFDDDTGYKKSETFMMYDYCQTQTKNGFYMQGQGATGTNVPDDYNFAPILTPVSQWDVNGNGKTDADEYFRFTESWRSTKTSGLALNGALKNDEAKLKAALQFVDYLYSEDGQIVSTFGPKAENADGTNGFWYGDVQTDPQTKKDENGRDVPANYFTYKGVKYQGYDYKGTVAPKITEAVYRSFQGDEKVAGGKTTKNADVVLNFTNYARILLGTTLPVGVKNQAFEDQLTSECGKGGSAKVAAALSNVVPGTNYTVVRGMTLKMDSNNWWYTCVPTGLPTPVRYSSTLTDTSMIDLRYLSGESKDGKKLFLSIFNSIILKGVKEGSQHNQQEIVYNFTTVDDLLKYMSEEKKAQTREDVYARGWENAQKYWDYLKTAVEWRD